MRQGERLGHRFERLTKVAGDPTALLDLRDDPASIAPERAIVFEIAGSVDAFYAQAQKLGLEYLGEFEVEFEPDDDFHDAKKPEKVASGRIYLAMPDVRALQELLSLWRRYQRGEPMEYGRGSWNDLFGRLIDVRPWGPQDRVLPEMIEFWESALASNPDDLVRFEIELWHHENRERRNRSHARLRQEIHELGGRIVDHTIIPEIRYDAALVDVPPTHVRSLIDRPEISLARVDEVMFLRPQSVAHHPARDAPEGQNGPGLTSPPHLEHDAPIAALLDGLPIQNHARLAGRLIVDDPDTLEPLYPIDLREHGTSMASLIIHGDLNHGEPQLARPLLVLPVLRPNAGGGERTPADRLVVDVIHRAVKRIKEGDGSEPATGPDVKIINVSLGDAWRPFARVMSPLGRLLDYLSERYRVLFLVSAGNVMERLDIPEFRTSEAFENADPKEREIAILKALDRNKSERTLLSPAEALNILTIGGAHRGSAYNGNLPRMLVDPFTDESLPNIASAMGLGFRKAIKPDLLFDGGRAPVRVVGSGERVTIQPFHRAARFFGLRVAAPDRQGGARYEDFAWGSSVATALATRSSHRIYDVLSDANGGSNHTDIPPDHMALVLKALLVHGASWGACGKMLDRHFGPQGQGQHMPRRDNITRLLGYGVPDIDRVLDCAGNRATMLGFGTIAPDTGLLYRIPLPTDLDGQRALRSLTVTLAWFAPINPNHRGYRKAALEISPGNETDKYWIAEKREPSQPGDKAVSRGTVFHERRYGEQAAVFVDDGHLLLKVSCRATAGDFDELVPYALAVSFEVAVEAGIPVYDQVRDRLAPQVRATVASGS